MKPGARVDKEPVYLAKHAVRSQWFADSEALRAEHLRRALACFAAAERLGMVLQ